MIKRNSLLILSMLIGLLSFTQQSKKALFVGNSYTAGSNLAELTSEIALSVGNELIFDTHTLGGQRFLHHAVNLELAAKINSEDWDFVSLQGQSVEVALTGTIFDTEVAPYAMQLADKIRLNNDCSQPVFFRTWGRENGFTSPDCDDFPWMCTYEGMDDALAQNYQILAEQNNALISPVGAVWRYLRTYHPDLNLYNGDGSHPSQIGSYAAAVTFYTLFFNTDPTEIPYNYTLSVSEASAIKNAVNLVLYQNFNDYDFTAYFNEIVSDTTVSFTYANLETDTYFWDFGDGTSSTFQNPTHVYNNQGEYLAELTVAKCGRQHTYSKLIQISALSVSDDTLSSIKMYPNPTHGRVYFEGLNGLQVNLNIYDSLGKQVASLNGFSDSVSFSELKPGIYYLKLYNHQFIKVIKLVKQ